MQGFASSMYVGVDNKCCIAVEFPMDDKAKTDDEGHGKPKEKQRSRWRSHKEPSS